MYNTIPKIHHDLLTNKSESNKIIKPVVRTGGIKAPDISNSMDAKLLSLL